MIKILSVLLMSSIMYFTPFQSFFIETDASCLIEKDGIRYIEQDTYKIVYKDILINEFEEYQSLDFCYFNNFIYLLIKEEKYYTLSKYSISGNFVEMIKLSDFYYPLKIDNIDNNLYLYGGINIDYLINEFNREDNNLFDFDLRLYEATIDKEHYLRDGFIMNIDAKFNILNVDVYLGMGEEEFYQLKSIDGLLYCYGKKDYLSGYIYTNGGLDRSSFLLTLNEDKKFIQIYKEEISSFKIVDDKLVVCTLNEIYCYDSDYSLIISLILPFKSDFSYVLDNYSCLIISSNNGYLIDLENGKIIYQFAIENYDFRSMSDYLYLKKENKSFIFDLVNMSGFLTSVNVCFYNQVEELDGIYGKYKINNIVYNPYFDRLVYGNYDANYIYKMDDLIIELEGRVIVEKETNVVEGGIYPIGYHLFFSGSGVLDGKMIYQNHEVNEIGDHELILNGIDDKYIIHFKVENNQVSFSDNINIEYDYYVSENNKIRLIFDNEDINKVKVNDKFYDIKKDNELSFIELDVTRGDNGYLVQYAIIDNKEVYLNYFFKVLGIIEDAIGLDLEIIENKDNYNLCFNINEGAKYLRNIIVKVKKQGSEVELLFPLGDGIINLGSIDGPISYEVYLGLYNGSNSFDLIKLFNGNSIDSYICEVNINSKSEYIDSFSIMINKGKDDSWLEIGNYYIDLDNKNNNFSLIISSIVGIFASSFIVFIRFKKKMKNGLNI